MRTIQTLVGNPYTSEGKLYYLQDPISDQWVLRTGVELNEDGETYTYSEVVLNGKPSFSDVVTHVTDPFYEEMEHEIEYGLVYTTLDSNKVKRVIRLTDGNILEWGMGYLMAKTSDGSSLPQSIFIGKDATDEYLYTFTTMRQMTHFSLTCSRHISNAKTRYWERRQRVDWKAYDLPELEGYEEEVPEDIRAVVESNE